MPHVPWIWSDSFYIDIGKKNSADVRLRFLQAVNAIEGLTVLSSDRHEFAGGGIIVLVSLAESHAALHTWPEYDLAWVGLFTCGTESSLPAFRREVQARLGPIRELGQSDAVALTLPANEP